MADSGPDTEACLLNRIAGLAARRFTEYPVTSVFLDLRPRRTRRPGLVFLKKELAGLEKSAALRTAEAIAGAADMRRIEGAAEEARQKGANQLAVFSSAREDFLEKFFWTLAPEAELQIPHSFVRGFRPHLYPVALLLDRLENFLLLVAGLRKGELFRVEAGQVTERWRKEAPVPPETRREKRGAFDRRTGNIHTTFTRRVEGHLKVHEEKFFRELAEKTVGWAKSDGIRSVILGADSVAGPPIKEKILEQNSRIGVVLAPIDAKLSPSKKLTLGIRVFRQREREASHQRVEELLSSGRRRATFGAVPTLLALRQSVRGAVLALDEAFHQTAPICGRCSAVAVKPGSCPDCGGGTQLSSLENELICLAAATGTEIEFVKDSEALARRGGAGLLI
jgi:hypothetical protein